MCWYGLFLLYECFHTCSLHNVALQQFQVYDGDFGSLLMLICVISFSVINMQVPVCRHVR